MVEGAVAAGLHVNAEAAKVISAVTADAALGTVHRMGWIWALLTYRRRRIRPGTRVHRSVQTRVAADPGYGTKLPADIVWDDPDWPAPLPTPASPAPVAERPPTTAG
jgi:hypothetical protein